jgi:esterase/lipase superfamily enzyme
VGRRRASSFDVKAMLGLALSCALLFPSISFAQVSGGRDIYVELNSGSRTKIYQKSYALVIGIDHYGSGWNPLSHAVSDATDVANALIGKGFDVTVKTDIAGPDFENIFKSWFLTVGFQPDARLLVWFAGHGQKFDAGTYLIPDKISNPLAAPTETERSEALSRLYGQAFPLSGFPRLMKEARARHILVVFDACFAGEIFSATRSYSPLISQDTLLPARQFITSGVAGQTVSDDGMFARLFIQAITDPKAGADQNNDGYVTANELGLFLKQRVTDESRRRQTPDFGPLREQGFDKGDFVFALPSGDGGAQPVANADRDASLTERIWIFIRDLNDAQTTLKYIKAFPESPYKSIAEAQVAAISAPGRVITTRTDGDASASAGTSDAVRAVRVLFGTDRAPDNGRFGTARSPVLSTGQSSISIPVTHRTGQLETASNVKLFGLTVFQEPVTTTNHFSTLSQELFKPRTPSGGNETEAPSAEDVLIYVHGYNTTFDAAIFRTAQLAWDMNYKGIAAAFSWASKGNLADYDYDRESALYSRGHLIEFLRFIKTRYSGRIHLIGLGQGAIPIMDALATIASDKDSTPSYIDQVILLGPDLDRDMFQKECSLVSNVSRRITIYSSANDPAILVANKLRNSPRTGSFGPNGAPYLSTCADFIDATQIAGDSVIESNHSTFATSNVIIDDISNLLAKPELRPEQRLPVSRRVQTPDGNYVVLPR